MYISQLECWCIFKKNMVLILKKGLQMDQQIRFKVSGDITILNQWYLFGHVARASPRGWSSESYANGNRETCGRMEKTKRTPLNNLYLKREKGLAPRNICLYSDLREGQGRTGWRRLVAATTFWHGFMIANIVWKDLQIWLETDFGTIINIKNYFTDLLYYLYKPESLT